MFRPRQRNENAHAGRSATIEKPARRCMINANYVQPGLLHESKIDIHLLGPAEIVSLRVRFERPVGDAFYEKFAFAFEKEFSDRADSRVCAHNGSKGKEGRLLRPAINLAGRRA